MSIVDDNRLGVLNYSWMPSSRLVTTTTTSAYAHDERDYEGAFAFGLRPFERITRVHDFAVGQRFVYGASARHLLDGGVEVRRVRSAWRMASTRQPEFWRGLGPSTWGELIDYAAGPIDSNLTRTQAGFWLQDRIAIGPTWAVEPGVRVDWNSFTRRVRLAAARAPERTHRRHHALDRRRRPGTDARRTKAFRGSTSSTSRRRTDAICATSDRARSLRGSSGRCDPILRFGSKPTTAGSIGCSCSASRTRLSARPGSRFISFRQISPPTASSLNTGLPFIPKARDSERRPASKCSCVMRDGA